MVDVGKRQSMKNSVVSMEGKGEFLLRNERLKEWERDEEKAEENSILKELRTKKSDDH
jgi:hypothetical protein